VEEQEGEEEEFGRRKDEDASICSRDEDESSNVGSGERERGIFK